MTRSRAVAVLAAVLLGGAVAGTARAHEDPASDYLVDHATFLPFEARFSPAQKQELIGLVTRANRAGFRIRVAVVTGPYDLGRVPQFWRRPAAWAPFLADELRSYYRGPLLVVMPNGFGVANTGRSSGAQLRTIAIGRGPDGLLRAAEAAVQRLAAADGVSVAPPARATTPATRDARDRVTILVAVLVLLGLGWLVRLGVQRRRAPAV